MLKLLLDEHISPAVAEGLRRRHKGLLVLAMSEWEQGQFLGQDDAVILGEAGEQRLTLVTYDRRTIPPLLKAWLEEGLSHGGVVFVDEKTISPSDIGGLIKSLGELAEAAKRERWKDRVVFLRR